MTSAASSHQPRDSPPVAIVAAGVNRGNAATGCVGDHAVEILRTAAGSAGEDNQRGSLRSAGELETDLDSVI